MKVRGSECSGVVDDDDGVARGVGSIAGCAVMMIFCYERVEAGREKIHVERIHFCALSEYIWYLQRISHPDSSSYEITKLQATNCRRFAALERRVLELSSNDRLMVQR